MIKKRSVKKPMQPTIDADIDQASMPPAGATPFPIIGMGASAGGLDAFEQFFRQLPPNTGMAFVLVQHLDPTHSSMLGQILQRSTPIPVMEAHDQMLVQPNHVYVTPPNRDMKILHGRLQLSLPLEPRGQRMPIDAFMRSLAEDQAENAIGIVLSGTGTDGTLGLRAVLGAGGVTLVQTPSTAKFDGMPNSAIQAGFASYVMPAEDMPQKLMGDLQSLIQLHDAMPAMLTMNGVNRILMLLRSSTGHDFSQYKKTTITRRIARRMSLHSMVDAAAYERYLKAHASEVQLLFKELLINVTSFFRDTDVFVALKQDILPMLLADKPKEYILRIWVAGCATGEEAYSIAILIREWMAEHQKNIRVQIYATDLDDDAIAVARTGCYLPNIAQDVSPERLRQFFTKEGNGYRIKKEVREMIVFAVQNVIKDPPFTKLDLLSCRNLMIYLEPILQNKLIPSFHYALKPDGVLLLSPSESIGNYVDLFAPISRKCKFYRAIHVDAAARKLAAVGVPWISAGSLKQPEVSGQKTRETNLAELSRRMLLQFFAPASVVTDLQGNILYVHGDTGKYLRPAPGKATLNVIEMAYEGLQIEILAAMHSVLKDGALLVSKQASIQHNDSFTEVELTVRKLLGADEKENFLLLSFQALASKVIPKRKRRVTETVAEQRIQYLEQELVNCKETLTATIEEQQAANEEMVSSNEEMQSTNEELQSTNEELETSKEELQSVNEELITVNNELQANLEQLAAMQSDIKNLLDHMSVGVIFLDQHMRIRRFTREATTAYRLAATDIGRHLGDIKMHLQGDDLLQPAEKVLATLVSYETEMHANNGTTYLVRIQPYRSLDHVIDGVVLTFTDITSNIELVAMQEALTLAEGVVNTVREPLIVLDSALQVISVSHSFYQVFKGKPDEVLGHSIYALGNRQWDIPALRSLLDSVVTQGDAFNDYLVEYDFPETGHRKMRLNARRINAKTGNVQLILLAIEEVK